MKFNIFKLPKTKTISFASGAINGTFDLEWNSKIFSGKEYINIFLIKSSRLLKTNLFKKEFHHNQQILT
jgi:hypothetical protein